MKELDITIHVRLSNRMARLVIVALALGSMAVEANPESVTLNTYYPAPTGVYVNMITTQNTTLARDGGRVGIGTVSPQAELDVNGAVRVQAFQMPSGAVAGTALTSDASGNGTWQYAEFAP